MRFDLDNLTYEQELKWFALAIPPKVAAEIIEQRVAGIVNRHNAKILLDTMYTENSQAILEGMKNDVAIQYYVLSELGIIGNENK